MLFDETTGRRAEAARERLAAGEFVNFRGLGLQAPPDGALECRVFTAWAPENLTEPIARREFEAGKAKLADLFDGSPAIRTLLESRDRLWELLYDYGGGAALIARLDGDALIFAPGWPKAGPDA